MSARAHSSLMFTDEETGEPQQAIVSSKWCPLIARKPRLFLVSDGRSFFFKGLNGAFNRSQTLRFGVFLVPLALACLPVS